LTAEKFAKIIPTTSRAMAITTTKTSLGFMGLAGILIIVPLCAYVIYYRYFHPLAKYPGPLLGSFTNLWKAYQLWTLRMPESLRRMHEKYGDVVRVGPNDLSFNTGDAVSAIYKAGRNLPKTGFYDGFTTFNPNLFGTRDDEVSLSESLGPKMSVPKY
jgi:hypothetical protein